MKLLKYTNINKTKIIIEAFQHSYCNKAKDAVDQINLNFKQSKFDSKFPLSSI